MSSLSHMPLHMYWKQDSVIGSLFKKLILEMGEKQVLKGEADSMVITTVGMIKG